MTILGRSFDRFEFVFDASEAALNRFCSSSRFLLCLPIVRMKATRTTIEMTHKIDPKTATEVTITNIVGSNFFEASCTPSMLDVVAVAEMLQSVVPRNKVVLPFVKDVRVVSNVSAADDALGVVVVAEVAVVVAEVAVVVAVVAVVVLGVFILVAIVLVLAVFLIVVALVAMVLLVIV